MDVTHWAQIFQSGKQFDNYVYEGILLEDESTIHCKALLHHTVVTLEL